MQKVKISPLAYRDTGFTQVSEHEAEFFGVYIYKSAPGYGEGWFPLYDFGNPAAHFDYMYKTRPEAEKAVEKWRAKSAPKFPNS